MFFPYNQNNSGGHYVIKEKSGISSRVIIEADNADEANEQAEAIGMHFNGVEKGYDCPCCGDRWYDVNNSDGCDTVEEAIKQTYAMSWDKNTFIVFIHYKDGNIERRVEPE